MLADGLDGLEVGPPEGSRKIKVENPEILELGSTDRKSPLSIKIRLEPGDKTYTIKAWAELLVGPHWERHRREIATWLGGPPTSDVMTIQLYETTGEQT